MYIQKEGGKDGAETFLSSVWVKNKKNKKRRKQTQVRWGVETEGEKTLVE